MRNKYGKIRATIDRFEEDKAVLILPGQQKIILERINLPADSKEGDILNIKLVLDKKITKKQKIKTKKILSHLLSEK